MLETLKKRMIPKIKLFGIDRSGLAAIEFAFVAPTFFFALFAFMDLGIEFFSQSALDYAVQDAARQMQIGAIRSSNAADVRKVICADLTSALAPDCSIIQIYGATSASFTAIPAATINSSGNLSLQTFISGTSQTPQVLQIAFKHPFFLFPLNGQSTIPTLSASAVFLNE